MTALKIKKKYDCFENKGVLLKVEALKNYIAQKVVSPENTNSAVLCVANELYKFVSDATFRNNKMRGMIHFRLMRIVY